MPISVEQLRAARGLLGWSQSELAVRAGLSLPTVKRLEGRFGPRVSDEARKKLQLAIETAGVEFMDENGGGLGVRFRRTEEKLCGGDMSWNGIILHKAKECRVECIDEKGGGQRCALRKPPRKRLRDDPSVHANYKTKPFWEAAGASIDVTRRVSADLASRQYGRTRRKPAISWRPAPAASRFQAPTALQVTRRTSARNAAEAASTWSS